MDDLEIEISRLGPGSHPEWIEALHDLEFNYCTAFKREIQWETKCVTCWELELCLSEPFLLGLLLLKEQEWVTRCVVGLESMEHGWESVKQVYEVLAAALEQPES